MFSSKLLQYIGIFLFAILFQVLILNQVRLTPLDLSPMLYILFLLLLPFETSKSILLLIGFLVGLTIDMFTNTIGVNCASTVMMCYFRPNIIFSLSSRDDVKGNKPTIHHMGLMWFIKYTLFSVFIHHFFYYYLEVFTLSNSFFTLLKIITATIFSSLLIICSQYFIFKE